MAQLINGSSLPRETLPLCRIRLQDGGRGEHYPFDAWADDRWRQAEPGVDFHSTPQSFKGALRRWSRRWSTNVEFASDDGDEGAVIFKLGSLAPVNVSVRNHSYGPILYDFDKERGYVTQPGEASPPAP